MSLTDSKVRQALPKEKIYFLSDDDGLSVKIESNGRKTWSYRYTLEGSTKRSRIKLGTYPEMSLKQAREVRDEYKLNGYTFLQQQDLKTKTFNDIANEWLDFKTKKSLFDMPRAGVIQLARKCIDQEFDPLIGDLEFGMIKRYDLVTVLKSIENRQVKEPVIKAYSYLNQIYDYAVAMGYCEYNIAQGLNRILIYNKVKKHYPYLKGDDIAVFMKRLNQVNSNPLLKKALLLKLYTGVRGAELLLSEPQHFDLKLKMWKIPAAHIKQYRRKVNQGFDIPDFLVPLSTQSMTILESALEWSYGEKYVFSSSKNKNKPIHFNSLNYLIRKMGFSPEILTSHGLRSTFSTVLNDSGLFQPHWIEAQLSHTDKNKTRASYNHAEYLEQRINMMQWWADFIEKSYIGVT